MDPVSQGTLGASLAQSGSTTDKVARAALLGAAGGLAPDLDVLISSPTDPLLFLEFHRQFTHALVFIPVGALIVTLCTHWLLGRGLRFRDSYLFVLLGYATHGLLDACTTYGTQLLWPFSNDRIAWNNVSIIDPFFTLPILALVIGSAVRKQPLLARIAFGWAIAYLCFGLVQRDRAASIGAEVATLRGHEPLRLEAKPAFGTLLLWRIVYETETHFHVDAVHVSTHSRHYPGDQIEKLVLATHLPWLDPASQQARDIERFRWFSNDYLAPDPTDPDRIIDVRYAVVPTAINALWGIDLDRGAALDAHVVWRASREASTDQASAWWGMLLGRDL